MVAAELMAHAFLIEAIALITLTIHIAEALAGHNDPQVIAGLMADLLARVGLLNHTVAAGIGVVAVLWNYLMTNVNDLVSAVEACTRAPLPPPQNGNPSFTTVGCNQSGGFGANFNVGLATQACQGVIGNWATDYRLTFLNDYWTCRDHWNNPGRSPDNVQTCNSWVDQCVAATQNMCVNAQPPAGGGGGQPVPVPVAAPVAIAIPVE